LPKLFFDQQVRKQLETPGRRRVFWKWTKLFQLWPTHLSRGAKYIPGGTSRPCAPLITGLVISLNSSCCTSQKYAIIHRLHYSALRATLIATPITSTVGKW